MEVEKTFYSGLLVIHPDIFYDERGSFQETYHLDRYDQAGVRAGFRQDNISRSFRGVLRGLHFQRPPYNQGKLVSVVSGAVFDVAVDIREGSPTYGGWFGIFLSEENRTQLWIPSGFAHGFLALSDVAVFSYKCTAGYFPEHQGGIVWNDPSIGIDWPDAGADPILSDKDSHLPRLAEIGKVFTFNG
jgi:dTDP-4-dehydrorhamnose 3,5-epimerase